MLEELGQQGSGGDAVHIVIAVHRNALSPIQGPAHPGGRPVHIPHQQGIEGLVFLSAEEIVHLFYCIQPSGAQHGSGQGRDTVPLQGALRRRRTGGTVPFLISHRCARTLDSLEFRSSPLRVRSLSHQVNSIPRAARKYKVFPRAGAFFLRQAAACGILWSGNGCLP